MNINGFEIDENNVHGIRPGATAWTCPVCSEHRKPENRKAKCMSVFWDTGLGQCNHCGARVQLHTYKKKNASKTYSLPPSRPRNISSESFIGYCDKTRHIGKETLSSVGVSEGKRWMPKAGQEISVIEFPYVVLGKLVNVKYRGKNKDFMFEKGCELVMFNLDSIMGEKECVIVEGEFDALAFIEAGVKNVVSVPNGFTLPKKDGTSSINLSYLDDYYSFFEDKEKIILAVDNDEAGRHGESELINRFGSSKCWKVDFKDCKDANDFLIKYGKEALSQTVKDAKQIPIENVQTLVDFESELDDFWLNGVPKGYITGIKNLDDNFSIELQQYLIVTGPPQSGKSEFIDSMCIGYAMLYDWKIAYASIENKPNKTHAHKIIRKIAGFAPRTREEIDSQRVRRAKEFYSEHFSHLHFENGYDLQKVLAKFEELVRRKGVRCFVIDPYNKVRLKGGSNNVNEYTAQYLNEIDAFCSRNKCIVILSMHPVKISKVEGTDTYVMPSSYDIKGGGEVFDMAYHIIALVKDIERKLVQAKTLKVKFQHLGSPDKNFWFGWNVNNGRYVSIDYDPSHGEPPDIIWDNGDWLVSNEPPEEPKKEYWPKVDFYEVSKDECPF